MPTYAAGAPRELKAVILAAGQESVTADGVPILLQPLGDRTVIDYVIQNALKVVAPEDLYVVVPKAGSAVEAHLSNPKIKFVVQEAQLGTGHAVLQLRSLLSDFDGDLMILYGDTPLFSPTSVLGLLNRHRLKGAHLTLLTAMVPEPLPYGRIIRDAAGHIIDIIEEEDASPEVREIRELNAGAYIVSAPVIFSTLQRLAPSAQDGDYRLTDSAYRLIRSGMRVESYQIVDQDELQGINTRADLDRAAFILQKRIFRTAPA